MPDNRIALAENTLIARELERLIKAYREAKGSRMQRRLADYLDEYGDEILAALRADHDAGGAVAMLPKVEFHQQDWIPGFAAFLPGATTPQPESKAFCVLNLSALLGTVATGAMPASDLPAVIADSMMHEVIHVIEQWAGTEFSEERVDGLIERYRASQEGPGC